MEIRWEKKCSYLHRGNWFYCSWMKRKKLLLLVLCFCRERFGWGFLIKISLEFEAFARDWRSSGVCVWKFCQVAKEVEIRSYNMVEPNNHSLVSPVQDHTRFHLYLLLCYVPVVILDFGIFFFYCLFQYLVCIHSVLRMPIVLFLGDGLSRPCWSISLNLNLIIIMSFCIRPLI